MVVLLAACDQEQTLWQVSVNAKITGEPSESRGTAFTWRGNGLVCGAGFINTNSARIASNQNDLEFWCRAPDQPHDLEFVGIGKPDSNMRKSFVANHDGMLLEYKRDHVYIGSKWVWLGGGYLGGQGNILRFQNAGSRRIALVKKWRGCAGTSIVSAAGYHGSMPGRLSTAYVYRDRIYANFDYKIVSYPIGPAGTYECRMRRDVTVHNEDRSWVYTMFPYEGSLYVGGSRIGWRCARLYRISGTETTTIEINGCGTGPRSNIKVAEIYSQMVYRDALMVGVFPNGNLARVSGDRAEIADGPFGPHIKERYYEPQSMTIAAGNLYVGMYPWGQLFKLPFDGDKWQSQRLFDAPKMVAGERTPYFRLMTEKLNNLPFMRRRVDEYGYARFSTTNGLVIRHRGLFPEAWGQRITSLAVLNGQLCAGTGNLSGSPWHPEYHSMVPKEFAETYGRVLCAEIPNHTAGAPKWRRSTRFTFKITDRRLVLQQDGTEIAARAHTLSKKQIVALTNDGTLEFGRGVYGPFRGSLTHDNATR